MQTKTTGQKLASGLHHFGHDHNKETMSDLGCVGGLDQKIRPPGLVLEGEYHDYKHEITKDANQHTVFVVPCVSVVSGQEHSMIAQNFRLAR